MMSYIKLFPDKEELLELLTTEQKGIILEALFRYAFHDEEPVIDDVATRIVWTTLRQSLDFSKKKAEAGAKGGTVTQKNIRMQNSVTENDVASSSASSSAIAVLQGSSKLASSKNQANAKQIQAPFKPQEQEHIQEQDNIYITNSNIDDTYNPNSIVYTYNNNSDSYIAPSVFDTLDELDKQDEKPKKKRTKKVTQDDSPVVIEIPLNDGSTFPVTENYVTQLADAYQAVDVVSELKRMVLWCDGNPQRKKTKVGVKTFITSWLSREQNRGHGFPRMINSIDQIKNIGRYDYEHGEGAVPDLL